MASPNLLHLIHMPLVNIPKYLTNEKTGTWKQNRIFQGALLKVVAWGIKMARL